MTTTNTNPTTTTKLLLQTLLLLLLLLLISTALYQDTSDAGCIAAAVIRAGGAGVAGSVGVKGGVETLQECNN